MAKSPKCFNRLYVNMIKAGEAGGALESYPSAPGRFPGTGRITQAQSQRSDGLSDRRHYRCGWHLDLHHGSRLFLNLKKSLSSSIWNSLL